MNQKFGVKAVLIKNRPNINSYFAILEAWKIFYFENRFIFVDKYESKILSTN